MYVQTARAAKAGIRMFTTIQDGRNAEVVLRQHAANSNSSK
jgi:hypothetical protein